jgi:hypothetical protein
MSRILVSKGLVAGLAGVAGAAVLGVVFLLGRASASGGPPARPVEPAAPASAAAPAAVPDRPAPAPEPVQALSPAPAAPPRLQAAAPASSLPPGEADRLAVAAYFRAVEKIQPAQSGSPEVVAQSLMAGVAKGDTTEFDSLIRQAQGTRDRMAGLTPPPPCAAYHRESLATLDAGLELMRGLKQALAGSGPSTAALDLAATANALKTRTEALEEQEKALKQRYRE